MSGRIHARPLPNAIGISEIKDVELRQVTMLIMENIRSLKTQLDETQMAVRGLQGRRT